MPIVVNTNSAATSASLTLVKQMMLAEAYPGYLLELG